MRIITISREFGSGGRELGKRLADHLGVPHYDREIITQIAQKTALDESYVETALERGVVRAFPITIGRTFAFLPTTPYDTATLLREQQHVLQSLAAHGDCVVVGRNADIILAPFHPFKLFIYADMPSKIRRCRERGSDGERLSDHELEKKIRHVDQHRAHYHGILSDLAWGAREGYHLCVNTTGLELQNLAPMVAEYATLWFQQQNHSEGLRRLSR